MEIDTTQFGYTFGDLSSITDPLGNVTNVFTDTVGRTKKVIDALGNATSYVYDSLDNLKQITDANSGITKLQYDPNNNLTMVTDANLNQTIYGYDVRNQRQSRQDALLVSESYQYDGNGNMTQFTDRRGKVTKYEYDGINRRTFIGYGWNGSTYSSTITNSFDGGDRLYQAVDTIAGTFTRTWDGLNRLQQEVSPQGTVAYTYDNSNRRCTLAVTPAGSGQTTVSYSYTWDNANRLNNVYLGNGGCSSTGPGAVGVTYDNANRRAQLTLPNGVTVAYGYDADSRITTLTYTGGSTQLGTLTYQYDADGRRSQVGGTLATVTLPANVAGGSSTTYNADNEQTAFNGASLTFDANGNLQQDASAIYGFDDRNQLNNFTKGSATQSFVYDPFGRRLSQTNSGCSLQFPTCVTTYLYDGYNPAQEIVTNKGGGKTITNVLNGLRVDERFTRTDPIGNVSTFLSGALNSTVALVGAAQTITNAYTYQPFGGTLGVGSNPYLFTGRENDITGLYYYRARYYSPTYQRFIAQDPLDFAGDDANLYAYTSNSPVSYADPMGLRFPPPQPPQGGPGDWGETVGRLLLKYFHYDDAPGDMQMPQLPGTAPTPSFAPAQPQLQFPPACEMTGTCPEPPGACFN